MEVYKKAITKINENEKNNAKIINIIKKGKLQNFQSNIMNKNTNKKEKKKKKNFLYNY